jgi:hypothetical protein
MKLTYTRLSNATSTTFQRVRLCYCQLPHFGSIVRPDRFLGAPLSFGSPWSAAQSRGWAAFNFGVNVFP